MDSNATTFTSAHEPPHRLYTNVDLSKLSSLEQLWASWYIWIGDPVLATKILAFLTLEIAYFGGSLPSIIIDAIPYFRKWKIQTNKIPTSREQWECVLRILSSHIFVVLPSIWLFSPFAETLGIETYQVPLPRWKTILPQMVIFCLFADTYSYFTHRALHWGPLYRHIHRIHHRNTAPFGLSAVDAHPAEVLIGGLPAIVGPGIYGYFTRDVHIFTVCLCILINVLHAVDTHSGYDVPSLMQYIIPFWSNADHHDFHHKNFTSNYSFFFTFLDSLFGTDKKYREYRKRVAAVKAEMKGKSQTELAAAERRLLEEAEEEGRRAEAIVEKGI